MDQLSSLFLPTARSGYASSYDGLFMFLTVASTLLFLLITAAAAGWAWKYRRRPGDETRLSKPTVHSMAMEIFWSVGPLLACIGLFHVGAKQYMDARVAPGNAYEIRVSGKKWSWEFTYPNGRVSSVEGLHVPVGRPIKLVMTSQDVIHSFYLPTYRVKQDVLPGRYSTVWFMPETISKDVVFCAEYCGMSHSNMLTSVTVESQEDFDKWVNFDPYGELVKGGKLVELGEKIYNDKACSTCHSVDGSPKTGGGPSFKGIWGKTEQLADGSSVVVDDKYVLESILNPGAKIVKGYQPVMPSFQGSLKPEHIEGVIAYLKTLK